MTTAICPGMKTETLHKNPAEKRACWWKLADVHAYFLEATIMFMLKEAIDGLCQMSKHEHIKLA